jgi:hypothetical protein
MLVYGFLFVIALLSMMMYKMNRAWTWATVPFDRKR